MCIGRTKTKTNCMYKSEYKSKHNVEEADIIV